MRRISLVLLLALVMLSLVTVAAWSVRPGMGVYRAHLISPTVQPESPTSLRATWLGVSALLLRDGQHAVLIDPFFTRPPGMLRMALNRPIAPDEALIRDWLARVGVTSLDAVLVSHSHFDHAMDAGVVAKLTGARLIGSQSTLNIGRGAGLDESRLIEAASVDPIKAGSFSLRFIPAAHAGATGGKPTGTIDTPLQLPARYLDYKLGGTYSILIEHPEGRVLHHGSAGHVPGALAEVQADVVFLGVALIDDTEAYLRETVDAVGATRVIPVHWDDFTRPLAEPLVPMPLVVRLDTFFADMRRLRPTVQVHTLLPDQSVTLFPPR